MKTIRASEIGTYQFCQRAWWYQLLGYEQENQAALQGGKLAHARHSTVVTSAGCLQAAAYLLLLLSIVSGLIWLIQTRM